ncbi:hypothetical protein ACLKA7_000776 [Drosophila subpalustris]
MPLGLQEAFEPKATGSNGGSNSRSKENEIFSQTTLLPKIKGDGLAEFHSIRENLAALATSGSLPIQVPASTAGAADPAATATIVSKGQFRSARAAASTSVGENHSSASSCFYQCFISHQQQP